MELLPNGFVAGMTLDLDHLSDILAVPQNGRKNDAVGYEICPRYLNNTQLVKLIRGGWVGCGERGYALVGNQSANWITDEIRACADAVGFRSSVIGESVLSQGGLSGVAVDMLALKQKH